MFFSVTPIRLRTRRGERIDFALLMPTVRTLILADVGVWRALRLVDRGPTRATDSRVLQIRIQELAAIA